jgi:tubulin monoglycylase TTLL3/8
MTSFELFGYDFMIDTDFNVWLIEVNTNPCLETGWVQLHRVIPPMIDNVFRIAVDPYFPEPYTKRYSSFDSSWENRFELIFSEPVDGEKFKPPEQDRN